MSDPLISIIITCHNGVEFLPACLRSIFSQRYGHFEVLYVDNASTDDSAEFVSANFPAVRVLRSESNLGFGGGNNLGAEKAKGELLVFLNHDTEVTDGFLAELVKAMLRDSSVGIAQSKILDASRPEMIETVGAYLTWTGMWIHPRRGEPDNDVASIQSRILGACGTCMAVRAAIFQELGGFDPDFLVYYDDADLSWRARLAGYEVVCAPASVIYHWGGGTTRQLPSAFTVYHSFKNRLCSLIKLLDSFGLLVVLPIHLMLCFAATAAYLLSGKPANALAVARAVKWNILTLPQTLRKRNAIQRGLAPKAQTEYRAFVRPLPLSYFMQTSFAYVAKW